MGILLLITLFIILGVSIFGLETDHTPRAEKKKYKREYDDLIARIRR